MNLAMNGTRTRESIQRGKFIKLQMRLLQKQSRRLEFSSRFC